MKRSGFQPRNKPLRASQEARASSPVFRPRRCDARKGGCGETFTPARQMQKACGPKCASLMVEHLKARTAEKAAREDRKQTRAQLEALKPRSYWVKRAQAAVNAWVRLRDAGKPCISCGTLTADAWHAGHFYSTAARQDLRFDPANIHRQCAQCNLFLSGNLIAYRLNLPARIGQAEVDRLDGPPTAERATVAVLREIEATYRRKANELEKLIRC